MVYNLHGKYIRVQTMSVSQIDYSNSSNTAILTSPFLTKKVTINSYTPYNAAPATTKSYSKSSFPQIQSTSSSKLQIKSYNVGAIGLTKSSASIVKSMITNGYSATNALDTQKAIRAYGLNAINTAGGVSTLNNNIYEI